jgi:hypothetical protein
MNKNFKIFLGVVGVALFIKIVAQRGGFSGATIGNKSQKLQDLFKGLNDKNLKAKTSGLADSQDFVEFDFNTPFGVQNSKFYDNGKYVDITIDKIVYFYPYDIIEGEGIMSSYDNKKIFFSRNTNKIMASNYKLKKLN